MSTHAFAVAQTVAVVGDLERSVRDHVRLTARAAAHGARLVLFPELSLTSYDRGLRLTDALAPTDPRLRPLQEAADASSIVLIAGAPLASAAGLHIAALAFRPRAPAIVYRKQHLHDGEAAAFVPGDSPCVFPSCDEKIGLAICADVTHPEHALEAAKSGATVYAAGCFLTEEGHAVDAALLQRYSREHQMLVLMANYGSPTPPWSSSGRSAIWSPGGELLGCAPDSGEALVLAHRSQRDWLGVVLAC